MELTARVSMLGMVVRRLLGDDGADDVWGIPAHSVRFSVRIISRGGEYVHIPNAVFTGKFPYVFNKIESGRFFPVQNLLLRFLLLQLVPGIMCRWRLLLRLKLRLQKRLEGLRLH